MNLSEGRLSLSGLEELRQTTLFFFPCENTPPFSSGVLPVPPLLSARLPSAHDDQLFFFQGLVQAPLSPAFLVGSEFLFLVFPGINICLANFEGTPKRTPPSPPPLLSEDEDHFLFGPGLLSRDRKG